MGDNIEPTNNDDGHHTPSIVPWIQALAMIIAGGLAAFDVTQPDADVPTAVYALIGAIAIGVGPDSLWSIFKGRP